MITHLQDYIGIVFLKSTLRLKSIVLYIHKMRFPKSSEIEVYTMNEYQLISDYKHIDKYKLSFNSLAQSIFGIDFKPWYEQGAGMTNIFVIPLSMKITSLRMHLLIK